MSKHTVDSLNNSSTKGRLQNLWTLAQSALAANLESADRIKKHLEARRNPETVFGILTHERADELLKEAETNQELMIVHGITTYLSDTHYFITDGCLYDVPGFVPISHKNLLVARHRDFTSVKDACDYYATTLEGAPLTFIPTVQALADHLNGVEPKAEEIQDCPPPGNLIYTRLKGRPKSTVTMYYCVRYLHNPDRTTEYYVGGGVWASKDVDRIRIRLYEKQEMARAVIEDLTDTDWFSVEIEV